ncbi:Vasculin-like protein 1 [Trichoplax sp. H2]|nr:Vasculin-like protein 1 [Trichoplax sp. H2]|eukprot:RDD36537.1 Vasculin-like protein 1 [Trichoplax sp. H2]
MANKVPDFTPAWLSFPSSNDGNTNASNKNVWSRGNSPLSAALVTSSAGKQNNGIKPLDFGKANDTGTSNHLSKKPVRNSNDNEDDNNFVSSKFYTSYKGSANGKRESHHTTTTKTVGFDTVEDFPKLSVAKVKDQPRESNNFLPHPTSSSVWSTSSNLPKTVKPAAKTIIEANELTQPLPYPVTRTSGSPSIGASYKDVAASTVVVSGKSVRRSRIIKSEASSSKHTEKNFKFNNNKNMEPKLQNVQKPRPALNKSDFFEAVRSENSNMPRNKQSLGRKVDSGNENYLSQKIEVNNHKRQDASLDGLPNESDRALHPCREISISLEGEQRLLRAMGWHDESDDDSFTPITEDEKKEFLSRQMQHQLSGLSNLSLTKTTKNLRQTTRSNAVSCSSDSSITSSESSDNEDF